MSQELTTNDIPIIDPRVEYVGATKLRSLNTTNLSKLKKTLVIQDNDTPLAVLLNYEQYLIIQDRLQSLLKTIDTLKNPKDASGLVSGIKDAMKGHTRSLAKAREEIEEEG